MVHAIAIQTRDDIDIKGRPQLEEIFVCQNAVAQLLCKQIGIVWCGIFISMHAADHQQLRLSACAIISGAFVGF